MCSMLNSADLSVVLTFENSTLIGLKWIWWQEEHQCTYIINGSYYFWYVTYGAVVQYDHRVWIYTIKGY